MTVVAILLALTAGRSDAAVLYVDDLQGSDAFDGTTQRPIDADSGPTRTIGRALALARPGDTIHIVNNGTPYYESLQLVGPRHSGVTHARFRIEGNGAVVSGLRSVPPEAWQRVGQDLWKMTPRRKGYYLLLADGKPLPELRLEQRPSSLPEIPEGHWTAFRGSIYYQAARLEEPAEGAFQFAYSSVGLTLYGVHDVEVRDLTFRHFRLDGVNAHDFCRDVVLENVTAVENGRAGMAVGGTAEIAIRVSRLADNRTDQLRVSELGVADVDEQTELSAPPTIVPRQ